MISLLREKHPCTVCSFRRDEWKKDVFSQLTLHPRGCRKNIDVVRCEADPWEIAKVFMGRGDDEGRTSAATTDPIGLLQLVLNCQLFTDCVYNRETFESVSV